MYRGDFHIACLNAIYARTISSSRNRHPNTDTSNEILKCINPLSKAISENLEKPVCNDD